MTTEPAHPAFAALGRERFVSLATFRRSGEAVSTPVWVAADGAALVVTTPAGSGKVKRLRHDSRVQLVPCGRVGKVAGGAVPVPGVAEVVTDPSAVRELTALVRRKYRTEYLVVMAIERLGRRGGERAVLRISPA